MSLPHIPTSPAYNLKYTLTPKLLPHSPISPSYSPTLDASDDDEIDADEVDADASDTDKDDFDTSYAYGAKADPNEVDTSI